jgi:hypothetical protein
VYGRTVTAPQSTRGRACSSMDSSGAPSLPLDNGMISSSGTQDSHAEIFGSGPISPVAALVRHGTHLQHAFTN